MQPFPDRLGHHLIVEFFDVEPSRLRDRESLMEALTGALARARFSVIETAGAHQFEGGGEGVTGFVLLAQSHAAFHSYPEYRYLALDIYSCGSHDPGPVAQDFAASLGAGEMRRAECVRGPRLLPGDGYETAHLVVETPSD